MARHTRYIEELTSSERAPAKKPQIGQRAIENLLRTKSKHSVDLVFSLEFLMTPDALNCKSQTQASGESYFNSDVGVLRLGVGVASLGDLFACSLWLTGRVRCFRVWTFDRTRRVHNVAREDEIGDSAGEVQALDRCLFGIAESLLVTSGWILCDILSYSTS